MNSRFGHQSGLLQHVYVQNITRLTATIISVSASFGLVATAANATATPTVMSGADAVQKLEMRFFHHDFTRDTAEGRVSRLESEIYGSKQTGDLKPRVMNLMTTVYTRDANANVMALGSASTKTTAPAQTSSPKPVAQNTRASKWIGTEYSGQYPRVSKLETTLLGKTYEGEEVSGRVSRLETRLFGAPSKANDLSKRIDLLNIAAQIPEPKSEDNFWLPVPKKPNPDMLSRSIVPANNNSARPAWKAPLPTITVAQASAPVQQQVAPAAITKHPFWHKVKSAIVNVVADNEGPAIQDEPRGIEFGTGSL